MSDRPPPYSYPFELANLSERGAELSLSLDAAERARVAAWLGIVDVARLDAKIRLARAGGDVYRYEAEFASEIVQSCVVTLEPVPAAIKGSTTRRYHVSGKAASRRQAREVRVLVGEDDEDTEELAGSLLDVAAPVLEELSLSLDPYPRAPGVTFEAPKEAPEGSESPFAVLAKLRGASTGKAKPRK